MKREKIGSPEEESAASSSTQSASGLGGGTPDGRPSDGRDMEREERGRDRVGETPAQGTERADRDADSDAGRDNPTLPDDDSSLRTEI
jgi:hypothetical protein